MPVVLRIGPYVFFFYSLENNRGYPLHEVRHLGRLVEEHRELLLKGWHDYFKRAED